MKQTKLWMLLTLPLVLGLASCSSDDDDINKTPADVVEAQLQKMTLQKLIAEQLT